MVVVDGGSGGELYDGTTTTTRCGWDGRIPMAQTTDVMMTTATTGTRSPLDHHHCHYRIRNCSSSLLHHHRVVVVGKVVSFDPMIYLYGFVE